MLGKVSCLIEFGITIVPTLDLGESIFKVCVKIEPLNPLGYEAMSNILNDFNYIFAIRCYPPNIIPLAFCRIR